MSHRKHLFDSFFLSEAISDIKSWAHLLQNLMATRDINKIFNAHIKLLSLYQQATARQKLAVLLQTSSTLQSITCIKWKRTAKLRKLLNKAMMLSNTHHKPQPTERKISQVSKCVCRLKSRENKHRHDRFLSFPFTQPTFLSSFDWKLFNWSSTTLTLLFARWHRKFSSATRSRLHSKSRWRWKRDCRTRTSRTSLSPDPTSSSECNLCSAWTSRTPTPPRWLCTCKTVIKSARFTFCGSTVRYLS